MNKLLNKNGDKRGMHMIGRLLGVTGEKHPAYKSTSTKYSTIHDWVRRKLGTPRFCETCKSSKKKSYDWANISKKYKRNLKDWKRLCRKCHIIFDKSIEKRRLKYGY